MKNDLLHNTKITKRVLNIQNKKQNVAYIYLILTLITVSFFGFFALRPAFTIIAGLQKQLADNRVVLNSLEDKLAALVNLDREYKQIEPNLDLIYEAIPTSPQTAPLIRQIQKLTQAHTLTIASLETDVIEGFPLEGSNKLYSYKFNLRVLGQEQNIQSFLVSLVSFNRALSIERIITEKDAEASSQASIEGVAYFLPDAN